MLAALKEAEGNLGGFSGASAEKIKAVTTQLGQEMEPLVPRAYIRTVKAGEIAWRCNQLALQLKDSIAAKDEGAAVETVDKLGVELGDLINKTKTFVIRMT
jgi:hypothetical protein